MGVNTIGDSKPAVSNGTATADYGKPTSHDPEFRGPLQTRSCTDVICCFLFLVFVLAWSFLGVYALMYGEPSRLLHPTDSEGRICGTKTSNYDLRNDSLLFMFDLTKCVSSATLMHGCPTPQVCVKSCPDDYFLFTTSKLIQTTFSHKPEDVAAFCLPEIRSTLTSQGDISKAVQMNACPRYWVPQKPLFGRCLPSVLLNPAELAFAVDADKHYNASMGQLPNATSINKESKFVKMMLEIKDVLENLAEDVERLWPILVGFFIGTMVVSLVWIVLMRYVSSVIVWFSIVAIILLLSVGTSLLWYRWYEVRYLHKNGIKFELTLNLSSYWQMTDVILGSAIAVSIILVVTVLILIFLRKRIKIAVALIDESSRALGHMLSTLFFPILPFLLYLVTLAVWGFIAVHLASSGEPICEWLDQSDNVTIDDEMTSSMSTMTASLTSTMTSSMSSKTAHANNTSIIQTRCDCSLAKIEGMAVDLKNAVTGGSVSTARCQFLRYQKHKYLFWFQVYNVFLLFWILCFISGLQEMTLAGAFASYYWAYNKPKDIPSFPLLNSFGRAITYHSGSIAFGSLILALVKLIRAALDYIDSKLKHVENPVAKGFMKCCQCCFWCFEKFMKFLTKNAFIMVAIYGKSFLWSAKESFFLLMRNVVRVFVLDKVTDFVLLIGKMVIVTSAGLLSYFIFSGRWEFFNESVSDLNYFYAPIFLVVIGSYFIASAFFGVYEMAVDTTFLCFLEDEERNDGSESKPYYMSKNLRKLLEKKDV